MGYPNPAESPFDLFMTGHAGCASRPALGLKLGDEMRRPTRPPRGRRHRRRRLSLGHRLRGVQPRQRAEEEAPGHPQRQQDVDLPARRRAGRVSRPLPHVHALHRLEQARSNAPAQHPPGRRTCRALVPAVQGRDQGRRCTTACSSRSWASATSGPIDGHDLEPAAQLLDLVKDDGRAGAAARPDQQGAWLRAGREGPGQVPRAGPVHGRPSDGIVPLKTRRAGLHRRGQRHACSRRCRRNPKVAVITAAMCEGNKLQKIRETFPDQFFDVGICESHAVAFAAGHGQGRLPAGRRYLQHVPPAILRPDLPGGGAAEPAGRLLLDRAGLVGADGPTHHGAFDLGLPAGVPQHGGHGPGRREDLAPMFDFALDHAAPVAIRYPKANLERSTATSSPSSWARPRSSTGRPTA